MSKVPTKKSEGMKTFNDLVFEPHSKSYMGFDTRATTVFDNGYGISVITGESAYTSEGHPYEVAVLGIDGCITYATPITDDVIGHCTASMVSEIMEKIQQLTETRS